MPATPLDAAALEGIQAPLRARYRQDPGAAVVTLTADGEPDGSGIARRVATAAAVAEAGLHPATGGAGTQPCSGDVLRGAADAGVLPHHLGRRDHRTVTGR